MRLYSRGQVVFFSLISGLLVALFMLGFGFTGRKSEKRQSAGEENSSSSTLSALTELPMHTDLDPVEPPPVLSLQPVQTSVTYTDNERENITIYERLNSAVVNINTEILAFNWFLREMNHILQCTYSSAPTVW